MKRPLSPATRMPPTWLAFLPVHPARTYGSSGDGRSPGSQVPVGRRCLPGPFPGQWLDAGADSLLTVAGAATD